MHQQKGINGRVARAMLKDLEGFIVVYSCMWLYRGSCGCEMTLRVLGICYTLLIGNSNFMDTECCICWCGGAWESVCNLHDVYT